MSLQRDPDPLFHKRTDHYLDRTPENPGYAPFVVLAVFATLLALFFMVPSDRGTQPNAQNAEVQTTTPKSQQ